MLPEAPTALAKVSASWIERLNRPAERSSAAGLRHRLKLEAGGVEPQPDPAADPPRYADATTHGPAGASRSPVPAGLPVADLLGPSLAGGALIALTDAEVRLCTVADFHRRLPVLPAIAWRILTIVGPRALAQSRTEMPGGGPTRRGPTGRSPLGVGRSRHG